MKDLPFTVIGGYLGAGKTTLLNHILSHSKDLRIAVLVNDFGSINIDVNLIRSHEGDTINLANGCMCCSLVNGFAAAIGQIRDRADNFDHLVIEASGVADPGKVAQHGQMYQLPLLGILVVADAEQVRKQATNKYVGKTVVRQLCQADLIVLNKTDLVCEAECINLKTWLASIAPKTAVIETTQAQVPLDVLLGTPSRPLPILIESLQDHGHTFETWTLERSRPITREALNHFAEGLGEDIYRAKGFIVLQDDPAHRYLYQQVGTRWTLQPDMDWNSDQPHTCLVIIGRRGSTNLETLEALLKDSH